MVFNNLDDLFKHLQKQTNGFASYDELFNESFIKRHSKYNSWKELFESGGFKCETDDDIDTIDESQFNEFLSNNTDFKSWVDMKNKAELELAKKRLGMK